MLKKIICVAVVLCFVFIPCSTYVNAIEASSSRIYEGIDVSEWQGYIDYSKVKEDGIEIVYIKASQGTNIADPYFRTNYDNAKANNLKVGFYHFLTARSTEEARSQAEYFCSVISGTSPDCRLAMDFEELSGLTREEVNEISFAFLERVEELTEKELVVYSDLSNARDVFSLELAERYPLWIAEYGVSSPSDNGKWNEWIGFQYTDMGRINGIDGYVDRDEFTKDILLSSKEEISTPENTTNTIITYTVRSGNTLSQIAREYDTTVSQIAGLNGIRNVNLIYVGEELKIDTTRSLDEINQTVHDTKHFIYTVKKGDTLTKIAREFGVSIDSIVKLNEIKNRDLIFVGEKLRINR